MKILLVQPAPFENGRLGLENALWMSEPAALTSIAAMVEVEHEVRVLDMRLEEADALPLVLSEFRPDLVGVTSMTTDVYQAHAVLHCARSILGSQVFTLIGGHHPTLVPDDHALECVDAVCIGTIVLIERGVIEVSPAAAGQTASGVTTVAKAVGVAVAIIGAGQAVATVFIFGATACEQGDTECRTDQTKAMHEQPP